MGVPPNAIPVMIAPPKRRRDEQRPALTAPKPPERHARVRERPERRQHECGSSTGEGQRRGEGLRDGILCSCGCCCSRPAESEDRRYGGGSDENSPRHNRRRRRHCHRDSTLSSSLTSERDARTNLWPPRRVSIFSERHPMSSDLGSTFSSRLPTFSARLPTFSARLPTNCHGVRTFSELMSR